MRYSEILPSSSKSERNLPPIERRKEPRNLFSMEKGMNEPGSSFIAVKRKFLPAKQQAGRALKAYLTVFCLLKVSPDELLDFYFLEP